MNVGKLIAGMGLLIAIFLVVSNANNSAKIITSVGDSTFKGVKVLQGRG